jgi:glycosyltransferase involved in cell wall biosynthesis
LLPGPDDIGAYRDFQRQVEPGLWLPRLQAATPTLFSIVVPFFNTPDRYLQPLLDSITNQSYPGWELIAADASSDDQTARRIRDQATRDPRVVYHRLPANLGIAGNTNAALALATGQYVVFVDHDDVLSPHALNEMAALIDADPGIDLAYSDEDVLSEDGLTRQGPFFKPAWSPHLFYQMNYTNHLSVVRRDLVAQAGGLRPQRDGAQDYDLLLRLHARHPALRVGHVPKVLYHWRQAEHSTARDITTKSYAVDAGRAALVDHLGALGVDQAGVTDVPGRPGWYRLHPRWRCRALVVVALGDDRRVSWHFARRLARATTADWVVPTWLATTPGADLAALAQRHRAEVVVLVRGAYLPQQASWLDDLAGVLALPHTGAVAPLLVSRAGTLVDAGLVRQAGQLVGLYAGCQPNYVGLAGPGDLVRDCDGLNSAVVAFPVSAAQRDWWSQAQLDARGWAGRLVLWGHTRCQAISAGPVSEVLNPALVLAGGWVRLRGTTARG